MGHHRLNGPALVNVMREEQVRRMDTDEVIQHTILALSFTVLVITGFSLRFYNSWWSNMFFGFEGGSILRGMLHRISRRGDDSGNCLTLSVFIHCAGWCIPMGYDAETGGLPAVFPDDAIQSRRYR